MFKLILKTIDAVIRMLESVISARKAEVETIDRAVEALEEKRRKAVSEYHAASAMVKRLRELRAA